MSIRLHVGVVLNMFLLWRRLLASVIECLSWILRGVLMLIHLLGRGNHSTVHRYFTFLRVAGFFTVRDKFAVAAQVKKEKKRIAQRSELL